MTFLYIVVALVFIFDFLNGFHDSANSIATVVSTKVLSPLAAVIMAAFFNFIAFTVFPLKVAHTIGKGVVNPDVLNMTVIASALVAAIIWNLLTWWWGFLQVHHILLSEVLLELQLHMQESASIIFSGVIKIVAFIFIAPILGMVLSFIISSFVVYLFRKFTPSNVDKIFRKLQLISSSALQSWSWWK